MMLYRFKRYESSTFCGKIDDRLDMYCDVYIIVSMNYFQPRNELQQCLFSTSEGLKLLAKGSCKRNYNDKKVKGQTK